MSEYIELIAELKPKNNQTYAIADVNDFRGGYIQVDTVAEMEAFLTTNKLKEGMLCYVKQSANGVHMFQLIGAAWTAWSGTSGGGGGGMSLIVVDYLIDLENEDLQLTGQLVYVNEVQDLRYYNGTTWNSFSRIYIQNSPPEDKGGIWIDTFEDKQILNSSQVIQNLLQVVSILQDKVNQLEWALKSQLDLGDFTNNQRYEYDGTPNVEPTYGIDEEVDVTEQSENLVSGFIIDEEPVDANNILPNGRHLCIKSGTEAEMLVNKDDFLPKELLWCYDTQTLWIKDPKTYKLIKIGSTGDGPIIDETMEQILTEVIGTGSSAITKIVGIEFADMSDKNNTYLVQVNNGQLEVYDYKLDINNLAGNAQNISSGIYYSNPYFPISASSVGSTKSPKIHINMIYTGGDGGKFDYNYSSHNFIELVNLTPVDLNLKGLFLHYTERGATDTSRNWVTLPLRGLIKAGGTFLIRGAQCSVKDINTTYLKVENYDMEWTKDSTYNPLVLEVQEDVGAGVVAHSIWDEDNLIKFNTNCAVYLSSSEPPVAGIDYYKITPFQVPSPYLSGTCVKWYVDLIGIGSYNSVTMPCEATALANVGSKYLHLRYYSMDSVYNTEKELKTRKNSTDWTSIDLSNIPPEYDIIDYIPKTSQESKNLFYNKDLLKEGAPEIITCTFGHNAHTTRCFNWISVGYYNEYIQIIPDGGTYTETLGVDMFESFKFGDERTVTKNWNNSIYNRIREISTDGTAFTVHKFIKDFEEPVTTQVYKYKVGRPGFWSEERSFTLRSRQHAIDNGFKFIQVTDEQGFIEEEYEVVNLTSQVILRENYGYDFIYQTGDIAQNGNRFNEWISYFKGRKSMMMDKEIMYIVGNNDLCPADLHQLVKVETDKLSSMNVNYFFTFEHPYSIPTSSSGVYIPSIYSFIFGDTYFLAMNSEISANAATQIFNQDPLINIYSSTIKTWCEDDLLYHADDTNIKWKVSLVHEAPFTIITNSVINSYVANPNVAREGSRLNTIGNYWYSKFLQDNKFHLNICGHKHTHSESEYIRESENSNETMKPLVYRVPTESDPDGTVWYNGLSTIAKTLCQLSVDNTQHFVKYVMSQATGYKLTSNKELPASAAGSANIPWLKEYYPCTVSAGVDKANTSQVFPHYIVWDINQGIETSNPSVNLEESRPRIKGKTYKVNKTAGTWPGFKYLSRQTLNNLIVQPGNGSSNPTFNIIVEKLFE